jgi:hypothetical protein
VWSYGQSVGGYFGIWYAGQLKLYVTDEGKVWGAGQNGLFDPTSTEPSASLNQPDTLKITVPIATATASTPSEEPANWAMGESVEGQFGVWLQDDAKFFIHQDGACWGAKEQGYIKINYHAPDIYPGQPKNGSSIQTAHWTVGESVHGHFGLWEMMNVNGL